MRSFPTLASFLFVCGCIAGCGRGHAEAPAAAAAPSPPAAAPVVAPAAPTPAPPPAPVTPPPVARPANYPPNLPLVPGWQPTDFPLPASMGVKIDYPLDRPDALHIAFMQALTQAGWTTYGRASHRGGQYASWTFSTCHGTDRAAVTIQYRSRGGSEIMTGTSLAQPLPAGGCTPPR